MEKNVDMRRRESMAEYTYKDVIIDPDDPRVEIGAEYYCSCYPSGGLNLANMGIGYQKLVRVDKDDGSFGPFVVKNDDSFENFPCIIRKKEPKKKYVPFDTSKKEDRNFLKGRWIKTDGDEEKITGFERDDDGVWHIKISADYLLSEDMLNLWTFEDGTPCGKLVEEAK